MPTVQSRRRGSSWMELLVGLAIVVLLFQFLFTFGWEIIPILDVRNWSRLTWFAVNLAVLLGLLGVRFGPSVFEKWQVRRERRAKERRRMEMARERAEEREMLERLQRGRSRRVY